MARRKVTQAQQVLEYMKEFGSITQLEALGDLGVMRLASRISDLRKQGYPITSKTVTVKNRRGESRYIKRYSYLGQGRVPRKSGVNGDGY